MNQALYPKSFLNRIAEHMKRGLTGVEFSGSRPSNRVVVVVVAAVVLVLAQHPIHRLPGPEPEPGLL
jgi:hypothetical protein